MTKSNNPNQLYPVANIIQEIYKRGPLLLTAAGTMEQFSAPARRLLEVPDFAGHTALGSAADPNSAVYVDKLVDVGKELAYVAMSVSPPPSDEQLDFVEQARQNVTNVHEGLLAA